MFGVQVELGLGGKRQRAHPTPEDWPLLMRHVWWGQVRRGGVRDECREGLCGCVDRCSEAECSCVFLREACGRYMLFMAVATWARTQYRQITWA